MYQWKNLNGEPFSFTVSRVFHLTNCELSFNEETPCGLQGWWHVDFKIICTWLAFELVICSINLTTELPIRDFIEQLTASDHTLREFATLLIAESRQNALSSLIHRFRTNTSRIVLIKTCCVYVPFFVREVRDQPSVPRYNWIIVISNWP